MASSERWRVFEVSKSDAFSAEHRLFGLPDAA